MLAKSNGDSDMNLVLFGISAHVHTWPVVVRRRLLAAITCPVRSSVVL